MLGRLAAVSQPVAETVAQAAGQAAARGPWLTEGARAQNLARDGGGTRSAAHGSTRTQNLARDGSGTT